MTEKPAPYTIRGKPFRALRTGIGWLLYPSTGGLSFPLQKSGIFGPIADNLSDYIAGKSADEVIEMGRKFADGPRLTYAEVCAKHIDGWE